MNKDTGCSVVRDMVERSLSLLYKLCSIGLGLFQKPQMGRKIVDCISKTPIFFLDIGTVGRYISRA